MYRDLILVCLVSIPYYGNVDKSAETHCQTVFLNIFIKFFDK